MGFLKVEHAKQEDHPRATAAIRSIFKAAVSTSVKMVGLHPASAMLALIQAGVSGFASCAPRETAATLRAIADSIEAEVSGKATRNAKAGRRFARAAELMIEVSIAAVEADGETKQ